ncbi:MAG TPA: cytochrome P450 [Actinobacteria bacterium]|nr:cytochrome P450 [Actinomycetota bacterium]
MVTTASKAQVIPDDQMLSIEQRLALTRRAMSALRVTQPKGVRRPPGPSRRKIVTSAVAGRIATLDFMGQMFSTKPISYARVGPENLYALSDPDLVWEVFAKLDGSTRRSMALQATRPILGNGILTSEEPEHRRNRTLVQPAFSPKRIATYGDQMVSATQRLSERWRDRVATGDTAILVSEEMSDLTLDIVGRTLFGADLTGDTEEISKALSEVLGRFGQMLSPVGILMMRLPTPARRRLVESVERLDAVVARMIAAKQAQLRAGDQLDDMLAVLIQARDPETGQGLSINELRDEVMTLVLAGHETTANALSWTWLELSRSRDAHAWVAQEWAEVGADRDLCIDDVAKLPRTRAVVAESMRLNPPAWIISRRLSEDITLAGYEIPKGSTLFASQYFMQRDPRFWVDAKAFFPQRWLNDAGDFDEKAPGQPRAAWFPFGFASRRCVGDRFALAEATLALAMLGRSWDVVATAPRDVIAVPAITLRPGNGIPARLRPRFAN